MQHRKLKLTKKLPHRIVDLPDTMTVVDLSRHLTNLWKSKRKQRVKVLNKEDQLNTNWVKYEMPIWQKIWCPRGIKITYSRRQRSFFLTYSKEMHDAYEGFLKLAR